MYRFSDFRNGTKISFSGAPRYPFQALVLLMEKVLRSLVSMNLRLLVRFVWNSSRRAKPRQKSSLSHKVKTFPPIVIAVIAQIPLFEGVLGRSQHSSRVIGSSALRHTTSDLNYFVIIRSEEAASIASPSFDSVPARRTSKHIGTSSYLSLFTILTWNQSQSHNNNTIPSLDWIESTA